MAGGIGSRFWPHSTVEHPKQFIDITGSGTTLIEDTLQRFEGVIPVENTWVVTSERYADQVYALLPQLPRAQVLLEPCMRNTAPCVAYAVWRIRKGNPCANLVVTPADHHVADVAEFKRVIRRGLRFTALGNSILTLGILPERPETGYGYIRAAAREGEILPVESFREKPDLQTACRYLSEGGYYWNSGIFLWRADRIAEMIRLHLPDTAERFDRLSLYFDTPLEEQVKREVFAASESVSIDYGVMERAEGVWVLPARFGWSDLGTWSALHALSDHLRDEAANTVIGDGVRMVESRNCMVHLPSGKRVVLQGLDGFIVTECDGILMVCRMEEEQRIKDFSTLV